MRVILKGNFVSCSEITSRKTGEVFYNATILSDDDNVRLSFDNATMPIYHELKKLKRFQEVELDCTISFYQGNMYVNPVMPDTALPE